MDSNDNNNYISNDPNNENENQSYQQHQNEFGDNNNIGNNYYDDNNHYKYQQQYQQQMRSDNDGNDHEDNDSNTFNQVHLYQNGVSKEINLSNLKTSQLIGNYQNLLSEMKNQISTIKGKFNLKGDINGSRDKRIQSIERQDINEVLSNGLNTQSTFNQIGSPILKMQDTQSSKLLNKNLMSHDENMLSSYQSFKAIQFQNQASQHQHYKPSQDSAFSPHIVKQNDRRVTENYHSSLQRADDIQQERNQRRILSSLNLRKSPQNNNEAHALISTSSNYKFTNTSMGSPTSPKNQIYSPYSQYQSRFELTNKENLNLQNQQHNIHQNSNSPMNIQHLQMINNPSQARVSSNQIKPQKDYENLYFDQIKMNKQLIDQVKTLRSKLDQVQSQASKDYEVKLIKSIQNEEYLQQKNNQLMIENQDLQQQIEGLSMQVEGSIRNNQELEVYLENCEVSQAQFTDKYKSYNKKIQDLNKKNQELRDANIQMEERVKQLDQDKTKLSEKWIRLSARQRVEEKNMSKMREKEVKIEKIEKQLDQTKAKAEQYEKENVQLKEENTSIKAKLTQLQTLTKDTSGKLESLEKEKFLADKVTNELLARIQRYEADIAEQQQQINQMSDAVQQSQRDQEELKLIELDMQNMQEKMSQINSESIQIQTYNMQLESDNQKMQSELIQQRESVIIKDQQIETLQLQIEHQNEQFGDLQKEFTEVIDQLQKKESVLNIKFTQEELQDAADYLLGQIELDQNDITPQQQLNDPDDRQNNEDQTITCLIVKAAHKIKYLNKYLDGLKMEVEEVTEKYDKLAIKYRDSTKDCHNLLNLRDVLQEQVDSSKQEIQELKQYIQDLKNMVKSSGSGDYPSTSQQLNHFQETFSGVSNQDNNMPHLQTFDRSPSIMHMYSSSSVSNDQQQQQNNISHDYNNYNNELGSGNDSHIYQSMNSQQAKTLQQQLPQYQHHQNSVDHIEVQRNSVKYLEKIDQNRRSIHNLSSIQHSYDHSRVCLPTRLLPNQQNTSTSLLANKLKVNGSISSISNEKNDVSLQDQIKNTLQQYKYQQQSKRKQSNSKSNTKKKSSIIQKIGDKNERQAQQRSLSRSPLSLNNNNMQTNDQQYMPEAYHSQRTVSHNNLYINPNQQHQVQQLHSVRSSQQSMSTNLLNNQGVFSSVNLNQHNSSQYQTSSRGNSIGRPQSAISQQMRTSVTANNMNTQGAVIMGSINKASANSGGYGNLGLASVRGSISRNQITSNSNNGTSSVSNSTNKGNLQFINNASFKKQINHRY